MDDKFYSELQIRLKWRVTVSKPWGEYQTNIESTEQEQCAKSHVVEYHMLKAFVGMEL